MTSRILPPAFFARQPVQQVAQELLGKSLVREIDGAEHRVTIIETEAYDGEEDQACHARFGRTKRTAVMYGPAGHWYVYLCYGMHWMLNVVTGPEDTPAAVLIRGAGAWDGPGKLTRGLGIDGALNGLPADRFSGLWIEDRGIVVPSAGIIRTPRIGVAYAGEWAEKPWRYVLEVGMDNGQCIIDNDGGDE